MIIMLNGAYGVGKTTVANRLLGSIRDSMVYDPEEIGYMLRNMITDEIRTQEEQTDNFQDLELWKILVVKVAELLQRKYRKNLIVPMTIINKEYFFYILNGFKEIDQQTFHFCLLAQEETIYERLRKRGEIEGNWCFRQTKKCLEAYQDPCFEEYIMTDGVCIDDTVKTIETRIRCLARKGETNDFL
jgi:broad-specificity NMP kinase